MYVTRTIAVAIALVVTLSAVGATAAVSSGGPNDVTGDVDAVSTQAIKVPIVGTFGDADRDFVRIGEDNNDFQVAFELNNGDHYTIRPNFVNDAADDQVIEIAVITPDGVQVENHYGGARANNFRGGLVQSSENTYLLRVPAKGWNSAKATIKFELDDDAEPGHYEVSITVNTVSQEES